MVSDIADVLSGRVPLYKNKPQYIESPAPPSIVKPPSARAQAKANLRKECLDIYTFSSDGRYKAIISVRMCQVAGCRSKRYQSGLCNRHLQVAKRMSKKMGIKRC